jgi:hypothetical protein
MLVQPSSHTVAVPGQGNTFLPGIVGWQSAEQLSQADALFSSDFDSFFPLPGASVPGAAPLQDLEGSQAASTNWSNFDVTELSDADYMSLMASLTDNTEYDAPSVENYAGSGKGKGPASLDDM